MESKPFPFQGVSTRFDTSIRNPDAIQTILPCEVLSSLTEMCSFIRQLQTKFMKHLGFNDNVFELYYIYIINL